MALSLCCGVIFGFFIEMEKNLCGIRKTLQKFWYELIWMILWLKISKYILVYEESWVWASLHSSSISPFQFVKQYFKRWNYSGTLVWWIEGIHQTLIRQFATYHFWLPDSKFAKLSFADLFWRKFAKLKFCLSFIICVHVYEEEELHAYIKKWSLMLGVQWWRTFIITCAWHKILYNCRLQCSYAATTQNMWLYTFTCINWSHRRTSGLSYCWLWLVLEGVRPLYSITSSLQHCCYSLQTPPLLPGTF